METTTIRKLFSDQDSKFNIPAYQRAYSWDETNIRQFIRDLEDATKDYYLGHFLFEQNSKFPNELFVIDGQQRLTTCIIFFSSLYHVLSKHQLEGKAVSINIDNEIRHIYLRDLLKGVQKLTTVPDDNNFFVDQIVDRNPQNHQNQSTESQKRIFEARKLFDGAFETKSPAELEAWHSLVENAECTKLYVPDKIKAAQIFAFQNDRGRELSNLEILKSYFMLQMYLHKKSDSALKEDLAYLESDISTIYKQVVKIRQNEDDVLIYFWRATTGSGGFNSKDVVKEVKDYIAASSKGKICERVKAFVAGLACAFQLVENLETSKDPGIKNLIYLNNLALAYPFFIRAHIHSATHNQLERLARLLENITFRFLVRSGRAEIQSRLNHYLTAPANAEYVDTVVAGMVNDIQSSSSWVYWSDDSLTDKLDGWMYGNRVDNYLLWRYEEFICSESDYKSPLKVDYSDLIRQESIEHIAPQTPPTGELIATGYGIYDDKASPDDGIASGSWLNCVGNLMLLSLSQNSSIGNKPFKDKLAMYGKDNLLMQQKQIVDFVTVKSNPIWDKTAIEKRHVAILDAAKIIWDLKKI